MATDNDLLTLWLGAGDLNLHAVRALIDELQTTRDTLKAAEAENADDLEDKIAGLECEVARLKTKVADLEADLSAERAGE